VGLESLLEDAAPPIPLEDGLGLAPAEVEVRRHPGCLQRRVHWIPMAVAERREAEAVRLTGEQGAPQAQLGAPLDLGDGRVHVPERQAHDPDQPGRIGGAPLDQEIVVRPHAQQLERLVAVAEETL
jgi:hypothetical protein